MSATPAEQPLAGRVVAVTGAARGIGAAIAAETARRGARVALGDLDEASAAATAAALGERAAGFALDVTDTASFAAFLDAAEARLGQVDVLVNNAGIMWVGRFHEEPEEVALRQFDVNLHGVLRGTKLAAVRMRERGRGHIVNVASSASKIAPPGEATYTATKHAVYGYSVAVREELAGSGVEVSVVMPVVVDTELAAGTGSGRARTLRPDEVAERRGRRDRAAALRRVRAPLDDAVHPPAGPPARARPRPAGPPDGARPGARNRSGGTSRIRGRRG